MKVILKWIFSVILALDLLGCFLIIVFLVRKPLAQIYGHEGIVFRVVYFLPHVLLLLIPFAVVLYLKHQRQVQLHRMFYTISTILLSVLWFCLASAMIFIGIVQNVAEGLK